MAVYTNVSEAEARDWLSRYDLGDFVSLQPIKQGIENTNYFLRTNKDIYVLTLFEARVRPEDVPFFIDLKLQLSAHGMAVPQPQLQRNGQALGTLCGRPAILISFLTGCEIQNPDSHHLRQVGHMLAKFHLTGVEIQAETGLGRLNTLSCQGWRELLEQCNGTKDTQPMLTLALKAQEQIEKTWPTSLPRGLVHADLFPDNVFFEGQAISGFIDFYFACTDMLAYDLAVTLLAWCFNTQDNVYDSKLGDALVAGYLEERPLTIAEWEAFPTLLIGGTLRFLSSRLYDWEHTPKDALVVRKDPQPWASRLHYVCNQKSSAHYLGEAFTS